MEVIRCVLLCTLEAVEVGSVCWRCQRCLEVPEVIRWMLAVIRYMLEALDGGLCLLGVLDVLEALESMRCTLLCMLEAVEGELCMLEVPEVVSCVLLCTSMLEVPDVMRHVLTLYAEGDAPCVTLYAGGDAPCVPLYAETLFRNFHCGIFLVTIDPSRPSQLRRQGRIFEQPATTRGRARRKRKHLLNSTPSPPSIQPKPSFQDSTNDYAPGSPSLVLPVPKAPRAFTAFRISFTAHNTPNTAVGRLSLDLSFASSLLPP